MAIVESSFLIPLHCFVVKPSKRKTDIELLLTKPLAPISILKSFVFHPLSWNVLTSSSYLLDFFNFHSAILSSKGEVSSIDMQLLLSRGNATIYPPTIDLP